MKIHEYQAKQILAKYGVAVPRGEMASTYEEAAAIADRLLKKKIVAGLELGAYYPEMRERYLFCVTETVSSEIMDAVVGEVKK